MTRFRRCRDREKKQESWETATWTLFRVPFYGVGSTMQIKSQHRLSMHSVKWVNASWPFIMGIHRSPVDSPHKGQWCGALMFSLIWAWINGWVNNREAGDLRRHCTHYDVIVMHRLLSNHQRITIAGTGRISCRYSNLGTEKYKDPVTFTWRVFHRKNFSLENKTERWK